ncbi:MAG: stage II sporulation protein M [Gammaproteobacteria bacterium]
MKQADFERAYGESWTAFEQWLTQPDGEAMSADQVPQTYRKICHHLALARARNYSAGLEDRLNRLALEGHRALYAARASGVSNLWRFFARDFPRSVRKNWVIVLFAAVLFYGPFLAMLGAAITKPTLVYSIISPDDAATYAEMYSDDASRFGARDSGDDLLMFGYYIFNNIGIGFRTFASGALIGIGALYVVFTNGLVIGTVVGHVTAQGLGHNIWPFVSGHSAFELNAIVLAGAAGLKLGFSFFAPGRRRRTDALRHAASEAMPIVYGFTAMLLGAAFIEAFWSSTTWPPAAAKYSVAAVLWLFVLLYFSLAGRARGS